LWIHTSIHLHPCYSSISLLWWCCYPLCMSRSLSSWGDGETLAKIMIWINMFYSFLYKFCVNCLSWYCMKSTMRYFPLWTREKNTGGLVVVRRRHHDTLMLSHYHNPPRDLRRLTELIHDHGNPLITVYCGACRVWLLWLWGVVDIADSSAITHIGASSIQMYKTKARTILILIIPMLVVKPKHPQKQPWERFSPM
jgi:hypothetical protein